MSSARTRSDGGSAGTAAECLRAFHAAVKSVSLAGAESRTHRECVVAECLEEIRARLDSAGGWTLCVTESGFDLDGESLSATPETLELRGLLKRGGLRCVHIDAAAADREIRTLLQVLGTHEREAGCLFTSLLRLRLRGMHFSGNPGQGPRAPKAPSEPAAWTVAQAGRAEEERNLELDVARALLADLRGVPPGTPYRDRAVQLLRDLAGRLTTTFRLAGTLELLELAAAGVLAPEEDAKLAVELERFCTPTFVRELLQKLPAASDPTLVAFAPRLGARLVPLLLREANDLHGAAELLEQLARERPRSFVDALDAPDEATKERALDVLQSIDYRIPAVLLESLATAKSESLRARALRMLIDGFPDRISGERALGLLEDPAEPVRTIALRRIGEIAPESALERLTDWFRAEEKQLSFAERKLALESIAAAGGEAALPFFGELIETRRFRRRHDDRDNRLCAIHAIGRVPGARAAHMLDSLADSRDDLQREAARRARSATP